MNRRKFRIGCEKVCSSENYRESKRECAQLHLEEVKRAHNSFCAMVVSGILQLDVPKADNSGFRTYRIKGKEMRLTVEEYNWYTKTFGKDV